MFAKVFHQILDSSIAEDWRLRHVFMDLLVLADANGVVDMTHEAIARRTKAPIAVLRKAIEQLESPDPKSRNPEHDGRRIVRLDAHRDWGWKIVNYLRYRELKTQAERSAANGYDTSRRGYIYFAVDDPKAPKQLKIGFSSNPWARVLELRTSRPTIEIVATLKGTMLEESALHDRFATYHVAGEWYEYRDELSGYVKSLIPSHRSYERSYVGSRMTKQREMERQKEMQKGGEEPPGLATSEKISLERELERVITELSGMGNRSDYADASNKQRRFDQLTARRIELRKILGVVA